MGRQKRDDWVQGPPGSKLKMNNMRGGLGTALLVMEQTLMNVPQGEVDEFTATSRELALDAIKLVKVRMKDLLKNPSQRAYVKLNDISSALIQFVQMYQTFAGYTTRSMSVSLDAVQEALVEVGEQEVSLDGFLKTLDARIEEGRKQLELTAGDSVIELGPEVIEAQWEEDEKKLGGDAVKSGHYRYMRKHGYLTEENKWTGLEPDEKAPDFVRIRLKRILEEAGDDAGRV